MRRDEFASPRSAQARHSFFAAWSQRTIARGLVPCSAAALLAIAGCGGDPTSSPDPDPTPGTDGGGTTTPGTDGGTTGGGGPSCSSAELFAGDPLHDDPMQRPAEGTAIDADPPFPFREIARTGDFWFTVSGDEIWMWVEGTNTLRRIAGDESDPFSFRAGVACDEARFSNLQDLAVLPNGDLVAVGHNEGAIVYVESPTAPSACRVHYVAGTVTEIESIDPGGLEGHGNDLGDGTGAQADLHTPDLVAVAADGTVYVVDHQENADRSGRVVRVSIPADYTGDPASVSVEEVARVDHSNMHGATIVGDTLYYTGTLSGTQSFIGTVDLEDGTTGTLFGGRGSDWGTGSSSPVSTDLAPFPSESPVGLVGFEWKRGQIYFVPLDGGDPVYLAGQEGVTSFPTGYDPTVSDPAELVLQSKTGGTQLLGYIETVGTDVYISLYGRNHYIHRLSCSE